MSGTFLHSSMWEADHGDRCDCRLLAQAVGAQPSSLDFSYCRRVLQRHWRVRCNHGHRGAQAIVTPRLPPLDAHDPLQAFVLSNMPVR